MTSTTYILRDYAEYSLGSRGFSIQNTWWGNQSIINQNIRYAIMRFITIILMMMFLAGVITLPVVAETAKELYTKGNSLQSKGNYRLAIMAYDDAIKIDPDSAAIWNNKGNAHMELSEYKEAINTFEEAVRINSNLVDPWYNKGVCLVSLERYEEALTAFERALKLAPNDTDAWYNKGVVLSKLKRHTEAVLAYETALKYDKNDDQIWNNLGASYSELGEYDKAISAFRKALLLNPKNQKAVTGKADAEELLKSNPHAGEKTGVKIETESDKGSSESPLKQVKNETTGEKKPIQVNIKSGILAENESVAIPIEIKEGITSVLCSIIAKDITKCQVNVMMDCNPHKERCKPVLSASYLPGSSDPITLSYPVEGSTYYFQIIALQGSSDYTATINSF